MRKYTKEENARRYRLHKKAKREAGVLELKVRQRTICVPWFMEETGLPESVAALRNEFGYGIQKTIV